MKFKTLILTFIALSCAVLSSCGGKKSDTAGDVEACQDSVPSARLYARLCAVVDSGRVVFGHHDDTAYGRTWRYEDGRSDVKDVTGDYPGLMNWDLGLIEWGCDRQLDSVPFDFIRAQVLAQDARGGINAFSWHPRNPATRGDSWDVSASPVSEMVTAGTALNDTLRTWVAQAADFILSLKDENGNRIPVLFRPWHEFTGSWFWWGKEFCTPDQYKALFRITHDVFAEKGVDNVLWVYSPDRLTSVEEYAERYPGDDVVDILGADAYHFNAAEGTEEYLARTSMLLDGATAMGKKSGKLVALSETGIEGLPIDNWYTEVLVPLCKKYPVAYVCVWRNAVAEDLPNHFYVPYPGHPAEADFKAFKASGYPAFASDMASFK